MKKLITATISLLLFLPSFAQESTDLTKDAKAFEEGRQTLTDDSVIRNLNEWQDLKFGMFIHWGTYSQIGAIESWSLCPEDIGWMRRAQGEMSYFEYVKFYEGLKTSFYPIYFDPEKWARAAKDAGMKYVIFTTKHHDGFNMFDTSQSDYKITNSGCRFSSNPKSNIAKEIFEAFRAEGIKTGAYYSATDWHNDDFWWKRLPPKSRYINYNPENHPEKWARYQDFMNAQLDELTDGSYGDIFVLWFDLCTMSKEFNAPLDWARFAATARKNRPGIMMVARGMDNGYEDYKTPEQTIPEKALDYPWESCITMSEYSWSYRPGVPYKTTREMIDMLVKIVSRGGSLLLNVGPKPDGTLQDEAYAALREIGGWMRVNSEGIYKSRAIAPYQDGKVYYTRVGEDVYAFYMADADETAVPEFIDIPSFKANGPVSLLGYKGKVHYSDLNGGMRVRVPESFRRSPACDHIWTLKFKVK